MVKWPRQETNEYDPPPAEHLTFRFALGATAMPAWSVKTRHAPSRHCGAARFYDCATAGIHDNEYLFPPPRVRASFCCPDWPTYRRAPVSQPLATAREWHGCFPTGERSDAQGFRYPDGPTETADSFCCFRPYLGEKQQRQHQPQQ